jgi:hypothetical protein
MTMAAPTYNPVASGYTQNIRQNLVNNGVNNADIGYNNGAVTIKGQHFMNPAKVYNGTSYDSMSNYNNAWKNYQNSLKQPAPSDTTGANGTTGAAPGASTGSPQPSGGAYSNPYDSQYNDLLKSLMSQSANPSQTDVNSIYASPQFAAQKAQQDQQAHNAIRAAQESMGATGFGRSTNLGDRAQSIQNGENTYLDTQVLPQLIAQDQAAKQQQYQNQIAMLGQLANQQGVYDTRHNNADNQAIQQAQLTGTYQNPQTLSLIDQLMKDKAGWAGTTDAGQRQGFAGDANNLRAQLTGMGVHNVDQLFGSGVGIPQAQANAGKVGVQTQAAREHDQAFAYQKARDAITDKQYQQKFDQDVKQNGLDYAIKQAQLNHQISNDAAQNAISQMNANTSRENADWAKDPNNPSNINKTPNTPKPTLNELESSYISNIGKIPADQLPNFFKNEKANIVKDVGIAGYNRLYSNYFDKYGNPITK